MADEVVVFRVWDSPFSYRVELALALKGVNFRRAEEDLKNKSSELLLYNPVHKKIPVLLHAGKPIAESLVILEYIDETWKQNPILPVDPYERANARFWATYVDDKCLEILWRACWTRGEEQQKCISEAGERLRTLETALEGKKFFGGDTIGFVDIVVSFLTPWMEVLQEMARIRLLEEENYPRLCRWVRDFSSCDVVKETRPPREKLVAFFATLKPPN
ncbi:unnamed protein product [Spirodela intermedia]|uniref:glutathione transferase n=1 Tax=Spirodela intermedia TaxID=51605 RepID=A0A7I8K091_SPIIN|nr:unnamed protein product [Spirodela intermedia]